MTSLRNTRARADYKNPHSFNFTVILCRTTVLTLFYCTVLILFASSLSVCRRYVRLQQSEGTTEANNHFRYCLVLD